MMNDEVLYLGRFVPVKPFRVYVYGKGEVKALVNSYEEYEQFLACGYFSTKEEAEQANKLGNEGLIIKDDAPLKPKRRIKKDKVDDNSSPISHSIVPLD